MCHLPAGRFAWMLVVMLGVVLFGVTQASAQPRQAVLTIKRDLICTYPNFVDHQVSTETVNFTLPEIDGPVSGQGHYSHQGTGYSLAGISAGAGQVRNDSELVLTYGQWNYNGEWMNAEAPGVPSKAQPVTLPLEPGAQETVSFQNAMAHEGVSCSGTVIYQIDFKRETQVWQVDLTGERRLWYRTSYLLIDPYTQKNRNFDFEHGFTFSYTLTARVTLEKRAGKWQVKSGEVTRAKASPVYHQDPKLYTIASQSCHGCSQIAAMVGTALSATSDGNSLILHWPFHAPVATVASTFALQCAPGPHKSTCEGKKKDGANFSEQDMKFFQRASGHSLPLKEGQLAPKVENKDTQRYLERLRHEYYVTRVK